MNEGVNVYYVWWPACMRLVFYTGHIRISCPVFPRQALKLPHQERVVTDEDDDDDDPRW